MRRSKKRPERSADSSRANWSDGGKFAIIANLEGKRRTAMAAREEKVSEREERAKDVAAKIGAFAALDS